MSIRSADPRLQVIPSFIYRANLRLAELSRNLVALLRTESWDSIYVQQVLRDARYLRHGVRTILLPGSLTLDEKRYIIERLLPVAPEASAAGPFVPPPPPVPGTPPPPAQQQASLIANPLTGKVRGSAPAPLTLTGTIGGNLPANTYLVIRRDGLIVYNEPAVIGAYSFTDTTPGLEYSTQLTGTLLRREQTRPLYSPILVGAASGDISIAQLPALLTSYYPGVVNGVGRFTAVGQRQRLWIAVPVSAGTVKSLTQPDDQDAEFIEAYNFQQQTIDFGADGAVRYQVSPNHADYIGSFTFDLHLTP